MYSVKWPQNPHLKRGAQFSTGLLIMTYNRPEYLSRCWESLQNSELDGVVVLVVDDGSDDPRTLDLLSNLQLAQSPIIFAQRKRHEESGVEQNVRFGLNFLCQYLHCDQLMILDSDMVSKPYWLQNMRDVHNLLERDHEYFVLSGFNTYKHPPVCNADTFRLKKTIGGANMLFSRKMYLQILQPLFKKIPVGNWDWEVVSECRRRNISLFCTRPSVVQHIGQSGLWSRGALVYDWAPDYYFSDTVAKCLYWMFLRPASRIAYRILVWIGRA